MTQAKKRWHSLTDSLQLHTKAERILFAVVLVLLLFYCEFVMLGHTIAYFGFPYLFMLVCALTVPPLVWFAVKAVGRIPAMPVSRQSVRCALRSALLGFVGGELVLELWHAAYWPGSFPPDCVSQLSQSVSGQYNDWHPYLHTILGYTLPRLFNKDPGFLVTFQIFFFCLACTFLLYTLRRAGVHRRWLLAAWCFIFLNPNTGKLMVTPVKDAAMTIFALVLYTLILRIFLCPEEFCRSKWHFILLAVVAFLTGSMRHNAILLVLPALLLLLLIKPCRKKVLASAALFLALTALYRGPVLSAMQVEQPGSRQAESLGLPMTILCEAYVTAPETMPEDARAFMASLGDAEAYASYSSGNYNLVKWNLDQSKIEEAGVSTVMRYTLQTFRACPTVALTAVSRLTQMVWDIDGSHYWGVYLDGALPQELQGTPRERNVFLLKFTCTWEEFANQTVFRYLFAYIGVINLTLLICAVARLGQAGMARAFAVLPLMAHNYGTMLLLCGDDFRFFSVTFYIVIPLLCLLFFENKTLPVDSSRT